MAEELSKCITGWDSHFLYDEMIMKAEAEKYSAEQGYRNWEKIFSEVL